MSFLSVCRSGVAFCGIVAAASSVCVAMNVLPSSAVAQSIVAHQVTTAVVETADNQTGEILLRDKDGGLITLELPEKGEKLPKVQSGDTLSLSFFQTIGARIAQPGSPVPESTVSTARGLVWQHPHGMLVSFHRMRVQIVAVNPSTDVVTFRKSNGQTQTVTVQQPGIQALLSSLKTGDDVDVTTMDAVTYTVLNRVVTPSTKVEENTAAQASSDSAAKK